MGARRRRISGHRAAAKSNGRGSARCDGSTLRSAEKIDSVRPGKLAAPIRRSIFLTASRCRLSCEPHSLQGMIGNSRAARVALDVALGDVGERPDHDVAAVVGAQLRRHRLEPAAEEQVEEQRLDDVVAMMAERDLGDAVLGGEAVQRAAAQARAQPAHRLAFGDHALHDAVGVLLDDRGTARRAPSR